MVKTRNETNLPDVVGHQVDQQGHGRHEAQQENGEGGDEERQLAHVRLGQATGLNGRPARDEATGVAGDRQSPQQRPGGGETDDDEQRQAAPGTEGRKNKGKAAPEGFGGINENENNESAYGK